MSTKIAWTEETWNPVIGCEKVSPGCKNCYAEKMSNRVRGMMYIQSSDKSMETWAKYDEVLTLDGKWNGKTFCDESALEIPLPWKKPRKIFVCSMGDLFHDSVPFEFIDKVMAVIWESHCREKGHTYQVLTKRHERMLEYFQSLPWKRVSPIIKSMFGRNWGAGKLAYPENLMLGVSAENQEMADKRIPILLQIPAAVRFASLEPLLGPIDLKKYLGLQAKCAGDRGCKYIGLQKEFINPKIDGAYRCPNCGKTHTYLIFAGLDWIIVGAESKGSHPGRECNPDWIESIINQCESAKVPCFVKQIHWKDDIPGKPHKLRLEKDLEMLKKWDFPQQYPKKELDR